MLLRILHLTISLKAEVPIVFIPYMQQNDVQRYYVWQEEAKEKRQTNGSKERKEKIKE